MAVREMPCSRAAPQRAPPCPPQTPPRTAHRGSTLGKRPPTLRWDKFAQQLHPSRHERAASHAGPVQKDAARQPQASPAIAERPDAFALTTHSDGPSPGRSPGNAPRARPAHPPLRRRRCCWELWLPLDEPDGYDDGEGLGGVSRIFSRGEANASRKSPKAAWEGMLHSLVIAY
jgi:hypothetical protein